MQRSAGILLFRRDDADGLEVLLAHMGGPYFARKEAGAWTIPKGVPEEGEDHWVTAQREFAEEMGRPVPEGEPQPLGEVRQASGKVVTAYAIEADFDPEGIHSNTFRLEWPPRSGRFGDYPEIDRAAWFTFDDARAVMVKGQAVLLDRVLKLVAG